MTTTETTTFAGWAILELMGHRRLGGYVQEVELAGAGMLRIDVPEHETAVCTCGSSDPDSLSHEDHRHDCMLFQDDDAAPIDVHATQFYSPAALYCLTPTSETAARRAAQLGRPKPVQRWELPAPEAEPDEHTEAEWDELEYAEAVAVEVPRLCLHKVDDDVYCAMPHGHEGHHGAETTDLLPF